MSAASAAHGRSEGRVVYVIGTYPLLTTTFIDREIDLLGDHGLPIDVISLRRPHGPLSPQQAARIDTVTYVLPVRPLALVVSHLGWALKRPAVYWGTLAYLVTRPHPSLRRRLKTLLHFGEGVHVARIVRGVPGCRHLHAHFVDRAATVAMVAGRLLDLPYSVTAHANDIYVDPLLLPEKLSEARFAVTCTEHNAAHLAEVSGGADVTCIHHGLELDGVQGVAAPADPPVILAVGQLKEKKGFTHLVEACRLLRQRGHRFSCSIVGEGPQRGALETQIREAGLGDVVTLAGALDHSAVLDRYRQATLFALPCIVSADGDRDGIPNVILEAMAMGLPVVSTRHSGIPEAVDDGVSGELVAPGDAAALADAIARLLDAPELRGRMGRRGRQIVAERFDVAVNAELLLRRFEVAG